MLSLQDILNRVWMHFIVDAQEPGVRRNVAVGKNFTDDKSGSMDVCLYFNPETNCRCAVGIFIPSHLYLPEMEEISIEGLYNGYPEVWKEMGPFMNSDREVLDLLYDIQQAHDLSACEHADVNLFRNAFSLRLNKIAQNNNLVLSL